VSSGCLGVWLALTLWRGIACFGNAAHPGNPVVNMP
jgi:hypothetical protein